MSIGIHIENPSDGRQSSVTPDGQLSVASSTYPPIEINGKMQIFRQHFTEGGEPDGLSSMLVDGSGVVRQFIIPAHVERERYIKSVSFFIADNLASLNQFGNANPLTNGIRFFYENTVGEVVIHESLKTNFDFVRLCLGTPAFGNAKDGFKVADAVGTSEGFMPVLNFADFGFQWGLHLKAGTKQKLIIEIRDDATDPDVFDAIAYGFDRLPD